MSSKQRLTLRLKTQTQTEQKYEAVHRCLYFSAASLGRSSEPLVRSMYLKRSRISCLTAFLVKPQRIYNNSFIVYPCVTRQYCIDNTQLISRFMMISGCNSSRHVPLNHNMNHETSHM